MSTHPTNSHPTNSHPTNSHPTNRPVVVLIAVFMALVLALSACGSTDDGTEVVSQPESPTPADDGSGQDGDGEPTTPPTEPPADPTPAPTTPAPTTPDESDMIPIEMPDLVGPQWYVQTVESASGDVMPRPNGAVATIRFDEDGTVSGNAACNDFSAQYTIDGAELSVTEFAITELACLVPDWSAFVEFLPRITGFGSAGGPDPILFVGSDSSISLGSTPPAPDSGAGDPSTSPVADYIGLTELEAAALADSRGVAFRVSSIDGEPQALTMDFIEDRVNVDLVDGVVVSGMLG